MFVCSSFLISVCMFIVSKALLISSATVIVRAGGAIWLNPFATVLFSVCSAVTVECCVLYPCCMGVFGMFAVMYIHLLHPRPALTNCKSCRTQHWELPQDAHMTQTYNICMTKHSHSPYTSTYSPTIQKTQHPSHPLHKHTTYFNTPRLKNPLFLTTAATQQTFSQTPTQSLQQT